eukprot:7869115-Prorocentrum_lima.AAC.1
MQEVEFNTNLMKPDAQINADLRMGSRDELEYYIYIEVELCSRKPFPDQSRLKGGQIKLG